MTPRITKLAGFAFLLLLVSGCTSIKQPAGPASATLEIEGSSVAYYANAAGGDGTLSYQGSQHPFSLRAIGGGGSGGMTISATGKVYNLNALEDFPGKYSSRRSGFTVGKGEFTALLKSDKGVQIYLEGETTGVGTSIGMSSIEIELK